MARILIIDDEEHIRILLREILQRSGYEVSEATNGKQGLRMFYENPADLVITDILMPVMPGSKFISKLRTDFPDVKIIAMSGGGPIYPSDNYLNLAKELGAERLIQKPIRRMELLKAIEEVLG